MGKSFVFGEKHAKVLASRAAGGGFLASRNAPNLELRVKGYTRLVKRLLADHGWEPKRQGRGDHEIWWSPRTGAQTVVDNDIESRHTANAVLKQAGLPKAF
jgi:hypothetical protein